MSTSNDSLFEVVFDRGSFRVDFALRWQASSLVLFGPSGSGKTTLLRIALGLEPRARARLLLAGAWLEDCEKGLRVPVQSRKLGWVPQSPTLFPDRDVLANIRFGARRGPNRNDLSRAIEVLELEDRLESRVSELSGGERQRVALARAIASGPRALLLDEPLAALDLRLRGRVLPFLQRIRDELDLPLIHITHDPDEAILLGDEIAVLDRGRLVARGDPQQTLWSRAVLPLMTQFSVDNLIRVSASGDGSPSRRVRTAGGLELQTPWPVEAEERLMLGIRAEDIVIGIDRPGRLSARNVFEGSIERVEEHPEHRLVHVAVGEDRFVAKLTEGAVRDLELRAGARVFLILKSQAIRRIGAG